MKECRDSIAYRKYILENLIDKPPFRCEKVMSKKDGSININENENVVNISFTRNRPEPPTSGYNNSQNANDRCRTTINLFINDPHSIRKNCEDCSSSRNSNSIRNGFVLGKNIPNHYLMENLLGDLSVKKFSSAPSMNSRRDSKKTPTKISPRKTSRSDETENAEISFLDVNDQRCKGDFERAHIEKINKRNNDIISPDYDCIHHRKDEYLLRVHNDANIPNLDTKNHSISSQGSSIQDHSYPKKTNILYKEPTGVQSAEFEKPIQPRRTVPNFRVRTQMVKDILNTEPDFMNTYYSRLMRNHKKMFETLKKVNFQDDVQKKEGTASRIVTTDRLPSNDPSKREENFSNEYSSIELDIKREGGTIAEIDKKQSDHILNGENCRNACSIESHGSYDEYKKKLIKRPDGTMCCKNTNDPVDDVWSRAETRNIITSEFIKDKIRRFDGFSRKKCRNQKHILNIDRTKSIEERNSIINNHEEMSNLSNSLEKETHSLVISNENLQSVSFPKETKNAMRRLLAENLNNNSKFNRLKSRARKWNNQLGKPSIVCQDTKSQNGMVEEKNKISGFWPGMAERVRTRPEENIP